LQGQSTHTQHQHKYTQRELTDVRQQQQQQQYRQQQDENIDPSL
jgi:cytochrome c-type biogenesis protein CcmE